MSNSLDIEALYRTLHPHLGSLCEGRVFPLVAPARTVTPFVIYGFEGGGETDRRKRENSSLILVIKCVGTRLEDTFLNARLIRDLLRDQGEQEGNTLPLDAEWHITTVSQGALVHMVEVWESGDIFYHTGHQYTFTMERKTDG